MRPTQVEELVRERRARARARRCTPSSTSTPTCPPASSASRSPRSASARSASRRSTELLEPLLGDSARIAGIGLAIGDRVPDHHDAARRARRARAQERSRSPAPCRSRSRSRRPCAASTSSRSRSVDLFNFLGNLVLETVRHPAGVRGRARAAHRGRAARRCCARAARAGLIEREEQRMSEAALMFGDRRAREVMTPRRQIDYRHDRATRRARSPSRRSRAGARGCPCASPTAGLEGAIGLINVKDLLGASGAREATCARSRGRSPRVRSRCAWTRSCARCGAAAGTWRSCWTSTAPSSGSIDARGHPRGARRGDRGRVRPEQQELIRVEDDALRFAGAAPVRLVAEQLGARIERPHEATVSGYLIERLGHVPEPGEIVDLGGVPVRVLAVDDTRISALRAPPATASSPAGPPPPSDS